MKNNQRFASRMHSDRRCLHNECAPISSEQRASGSTLAKFNDE